MVLASHMSLSVDLTHISFYCFFVMALGDGRIVIFRTFSDSRSCFAAVYKQKNTKEVQKLARPSS